MSEYESVYLIQPRGARRLSNHRRREGAWRRRAVRLMGWPSPV